MFRVVLHPHRLPRTGPSGGARVMLPDGWRWWRLRLLPVVGGQLHSVQYDHPADIHEAVLLLEGPTGELVDPPAFHLTVWLPEYQDIDTARGLTRTLVTRGFTGVFDVVHSACPGAGWEQLPGNTCRPGDYGIEETMRERRRVQYGRPDWDDSTRREFDSSLGVLHWPPGSDLIRVRLGQPPDLESIFRAVREYEAVYRARPTALLMSPHDVTALLRARGPLDYDPAGRAAGTLWGLEVHIEASLMPGQVIVLPWIRPEDIYSAVRDTERQIMALTQVPPPDVGRVPSPHVKPEAEIVDEIDRLVNEQIRPGPRDDYSVNRYPKCKSCPHDWHGLDCQHCDCLNTDWLDQRT